MCVVLRSGPEWHAQLAAAAVTSTTPSHTDILAVEPTCGRVLALVQAQCASHEEAQAHCRDRTGLFKAGMEEFHDYTLSTSFEKCVKNKLKNFGSWVDRARV